MGFRIFGQIRELESGDSVSGIRVKVMDKDYLSDDLLGEVITDQAGSFSIRYREESSRDLFDDKPDIYLVVKSKSGKVLKTTRDDIQFDVDREIEINMDIPRSVLAEAGLKESEPVNWMKDLDPRQLKRFTTWTWRHDPSDELAVQLRGELADKSSILELIKSYIIGLKGNPDNNSPYHVKLARLFDLGITPEEMKGHYFGVPVGIRTGDQQGWTAGFGNILGFLWGITVEDVCPWVGKSFTPIKKTRLETITSLPSPSESPACLGINRFNKINFQPLNAASFHFLNWWMGLKAASDTEKANLGNEKKGGNFTAFKTHSVYHGTDREVYQLNYRWKNLENPPPFSWLIDEVVQVGQGLYLGQLLYCTRRLQADYDPGRDPSDYNYQHFGYFLLFDEGWNPEARRLFPHLEMPVTAPGLKRDAPAASFDLSKFSAFTFQEPGPPNGNDKIMAQIYDDMKDKPSIMHLLKMYSDELQDSLDNDSPTFLRLQELFNRGTGIKTVAGFFRGALVSGHAEGLLKIFDLNTLNLAWTQLARSFSPWTGKCFEEIAPGKLQELTDNHEKGVQPTFWGANTQALRTPREKFAGKLMDLAGVWTEKVPADEAREFGYDLKCFFFIGRQAKSINEHNRGKDIFQFNYRWPKLKTIPPDCYCIDELVQIAEGLYLGQLMYATELLKPYDPLRDPSEYKYRLFGYFLLMDEAWHRIRLDIGFDLENV